MPKKSGLDATREIKKFNPQTPIIVQSSDKGVDETFAGIDVQFLDGGKLTKKAQLEAALKKLKLLNE